MRNVACGMIPHFTRCTYSPFHNSRQPIRLFINRSTDRKKTHAINIYSRNDEHSTKYLFQIGLGC